MNHREERLFQKTLLPNGIRVVTEKMPHLRSVCIGLWVPAGSRNETGAINGISHFLEHMLFKGTKRRTARDIAVEVDSYGGEINAFTTREYTVYYIKVLDEHLRTAIDILADIFLHSVLDPEEMEKERHVILEEIRMQEDQPEDQVHDLMNTILWSGHPLGFPVTGSVESVSGLTRAALLSYINTHYLRPGILVSCAGNVDHQECAEVVAKCFQDFSEGSEPDDGGAPLYHAGKTVVTKDLEQVHLCVAHQGIKQDHADRFAFYLINTLFGANMSSRLFQEVREKRGLVYSIYSYLSTYRDVGNITVYAGAGRERILEVMEIIRNEFAELANHSVSESELARAKECMKGGLFLSLESSSSVMSRIAKQEIFFHRYQSVDEIVGEIEKVTAGKMKELAEEYFQNEDFSVAAIGPVDGKELHP